MTITIGGWLFIIGIAIALFLSALPWEGEDEEPDGCPECGTDRCCIDDLITVGIVRNDIEPEHNHD